MTVARSRVQDSVWDFSRPELRVRWPYQKWFNAHIGKRIRYTLVREHWDRDVRDLASVERLKAEPADPGSVKLTDGDRDVLACVARAGVKTLMAFLDRVSTQESAERFCEEAGIAPSSLLALLKQVYRYLPFGAQMRLLVEKGDVVMQEHVSRLTARKLGFSLALLEVGRTREGRRALAGDTGIPDRELLDLLRRADLTRLRLMSGGMIRQSWALGYRGLRALQEADWEEYYEKCREHYARTAKGKPFDLTRDTARSHISRMKQAPVVLEDDA